MGVSLRSVTKFPTVGLDRSRESSFGAAPCFTYWRIMPNKEADRIGLPPRVFLYTLDQIAVMLEVDLNTVKTTYVHYDRRSVGKQPGDRMLARNIAPPDEKPEWRVTENEFVGFLKKKGFRFYHKSSVSR